MPPETDHGHRPEPGVGLHADDQLRTVAKVGHRFDAEGGRVQTLLHAFQRRAQLVFALQPQSDTAGVRLVQQSHRLEYHRVADAPGGLRRLIGGLHQRGVGEFHTRGTE